MKLYKNLTEALKNRKEVKALKIKVNEKIPNGIFDIIGLKELYLEGNFQGLPEDILNLQELKVLSLNSPLLHGPLAHTFKLPSLENLKVLGSHLSRLDLPLGQTALKLKSLTIKNSQLKFLPEEIAQLSSLAELNLSENFLTDLPLGIKGLTNLRRLNLDTNQFQKFPDHITLLPKLHHLSFDHNPLSDDERSRVQRKFHLEIK